MNWIVAKKRLSGNVTKLTFVSQYIAANAKPGQYVLVRRTLNSTSLPFTVTETNIEKGTVGIIITRRFKEYGEFADCNIGDDLFGVEGPYGTCFEIKKWGTVLCVAEGIGIEPLYPIMKALKSAGNRIITVIASGAEQSDVLREEFQQLSSQFYSVTCERESGINSGIISGMERAMQTEKIDQVISFGNAYTAKETCVFSNLRYKIPSKSILYTIGCFNCAYQGIFSISLSEKSEFVCVDGENFNAHYHGFDKMIQRFDCSPFSEKEESSLIMDAKKQKSR